MYKYLYIRPSRAGFGLVWFSTVSYIGIYVSMLQQRQTTPVFNNTVCMPGTDQEDISSDSVANIMVNGVCLYICL